MKKVILFLLAAIANAAFAQVKPGDWLAVTDGGTFYDEVRMGSGRISKNKRDEVIGVMTGRRITKATNRIELIQWYVTQRDCLAGQGKLVNLDMSGEFRYDADFLIGGQTVGSTLADLACVSIVKEAKVSNDLSLPVDSIKIPAIFKWFRVAEANDFFDEVLGGSLAFTVNGAGTVVNAVTGRRTNKATGKSAEARWYVSAVDCAAGAGKLVTLNLRGVYQYDNDYVKDGGTVGSETADAICAAALEAAKSASEQPQKSQDPEPWIKPGNRAL